MAQCTIHSEKCDKICAEVEVDEHIECGCECRVKRHHCNAKQVYYDEDVCHDYNLKEQHWVLHKKHCSNQKMKSFNCFKAERGNGNAVDCV